MHCNMPPHSLARAVGMIFVGSVRWNSYASSLPKMQIRDNLDLAVWFKLEKLCDFNLVFSLFKSTTVTKPVVLERDNRFIYECPHGVRIGGVSASPPSKPSLLTFTFWTFLNLCATRSQYEHCLALIPGLSGGVNAGDDQIPLLFL